MFVCCECCVLPGRGLCDWLIIRPEEAYRLWCVDSSDHTESVVIKLKYEIHQWMPFVVGVNTIVECLRTDCNIVGNKKKLIVKQVILKTYSSRI